MSSDDTKPKIDDTETEEEKSSQDEADADKSVDSVKKEEDAGKEEKSSAAAAEEGTDGDGDTEEEEVKKPAKKRPVKADTKAEAKESEDEEGDDDEEEEEDDEKPNGVPAKESRGKKKSEKGDEDKKDKKEEIVIPDGKGTAFGECPRIDHFIKQREINQLKKLHNVCFGKVGKPDLIRENLQKFKGFDYEPESDAYTQKKQSLAKLDIKYLKEICDIIDLEKKGKKDDIVTRIMDFLMDPKDSGKPVPAVPAPRPKRSSAVKANNRGYAGQDSDDDEDGGRKARAVGRRTKARPSYKDDSSSEEEKRAKRGGGGRKFSDSDAESEPELTPSESDSDAPKKKKATPAKSKGRGAPKKKATPAAKPAKRAAPKRGKKKASDSDAPSESEDEPLQKKSKKFPSDDEIKKYVKQILDGANLEEITMKTVCKQVYGRYPEHDLTHKKDLIKNTVKSLIAT